MKRFYNLVVSFVAVILFLTGIKAEAQYTYIKGSMPDGTAALSETYLQTLDTELTAFATANGYTIYLNLNAEILSPKVERNLTPQSVQIALNERRTESIKVFKKQAEIDLKLNNGVIIYLDFLLKNKIDSVPVLESYFMQTLVPGGSLNSFAKTGLAGIPQTPRLRIGASNFTTNQQSVQATIDKIKALFIEAKKYPTDNFLFGPLRVKIANPDIDNLANGWEKYICTQDTLKLSLISTGYENLQATIVNANISFLYQKSTGSYKNVVISRTSADPIFAGHQGFLNIYLTALNLTIEPATGINGTATLNTLTDRDIELQNLLVLKQGFGGDFQFTYSNSTDFSGSYNFSGLSNFEVDFIKDRQPITTITGTINNDGTVNATLATTAPVTVQAANFTMLVSNLNLNFDFSVKTGVKINSGSLSAVFSNIPGLSGNVPVSASYDQYGNIIANLQTSGLTLSVCSMQIVNPALNLVLDNNLDITTLEGSAAMKHSLFDTQIAISQFRWTNDRGIEIFSAQGGVVYNGFNFQFSRFEYNNGQFDISAKVVLNTGGTSNFLDVTSFTVSDDGSIDIGAISGQIRATLVDFAFQAEFSNDRFKGGFTGKIASLINAEGAVDIGQYKPTNGGASYTFCYIKIVVGSSTGIPLGTLPIKLTEFGGEYGYNYFIDYQNKSNPPTGPKLSNYILGLTLGIADVTGSVTLTGNPVAQIGANSASFTMNGTLKAPSTNPWFNVPIQAGFTLPSGEIYGGFTFDFKVPKTTGSIIDARSLGFNFLYTPDNWYVGRKGISVTLLNALHLTMDSEFSGTFVNPSSYRAFLKAQLGVNWDWNASKSLSVLGYSVSAAADVNLKMNAAAELEIQTTGVNGSFSASMDASGSIIVDMCSSCNYSWTRIPIAVNTHLAGSLQFQNTNIRLHADGLFQITIANQQGSFEFDVDYNFDPTVSGSGTTSVSTNTQSRTVPTSAGTFSIPTGMPTAGAGQRATSNYSQAQAAAASNPVTANTNTNYVSSLSAYGNINRELNANASHIAVIEGKTALESKLKSSGTYVLQNLNNESVTNGNMLIQYAKFLKANPGAENTFATNRGAFDTWFAKAKADIALLAAPTTFTSYPVLNANITSSNSVLQTVEGVTTLKSKLQASGGYIMHKLNGESAVILVAYARYLKANSGIENTFKNDNYAFDAWLNKAKNPFVVASSLSSYTNIVALLNNANNAADIQAILVNGWPATILSNLNSDIHTYTGMGDEIVQNTKLLAYYLKIRSDWWTKYCILAEHYAPSKPVNLPRNFLMMVETITTYNGATMLNSSAGTKSSDLGNIFEDELIAHLGSAIQNGNNFSNFPPDLTTALNTNLNGYSIMITQAIVNVGNNNPQPDMLFFKIIRGQIDFSTAIYIDAKLRSTTAYSAAQKAFVATIGTTQISTITSFASDKNPEIFQSGSTFDIETSFTPKNVTLSKASVIYTYFQNDVSKLFYK